MVVCSSPAACRSDVLFFVSFSFALILSLFFPGSHVKQFQSCVIRVLHQDAGFILHLGHFKTTLKYAKTKETPQGGVKVTHSMYHGKTSHGNSLLKCVFKVVCLFPDSSPKMTYAIGGADLMKESLQALINHFELLTNAKSGKQCTRIQEHPSYGM